MTTVSQSGGNLGDALWLTPLARYIPDLVVQLRSSDKRSRAVAPIFDGLCKVEFIDNPKDPNKSKLDVHVSRKILYAYGIVGRNSIPKINVTMDEMLWAQQYLSEYKNPIAFINGNSGTNDLLNYRAQYVCPPSQYIQEIANFYNQNGKTILQFGPDPKYYDRDPFIALENAIPIRGLSVRKLAACYAVIGKMIGGDTGDYHLMVAVGGETITLVPNESYQLGYVYSDLLYGYAADDWEGQTPRVHYLNHEDYKSIIKGRIWL